MSKPNLLYYFPTKEAVHRLLIDRLLDMWLEPLRHLNGDGEPLDEIRTYVRRKIEMARDYPRESRLFANEILQGAPHIGEEMRDLKLLVDEKAQIIRKWIAAGKLAPVDPHHLIFSIWATTQHYADFDAQVRAVLGRTRSAKRFEEAEAFLDRLYANALAPNK
jgi:TetR/AcrR family transcriptional regulator